MPLCGLLVPSVSQQPRLANPRRKDKFLWSRKGWKPLFAALGFTCIMFLIRSFFRVVELSEGYSGYLATHEVYWAALDALPLWLGIMVYTYFWPCRILTPETAVHPDIVEYSDSTPASTAEEK